MSIKGSGKVLDFDVLRESLEIRMRVGQLPEGFGFYDNMTALEKSTLAYWTGFLQKE